MWAPDPNSRTYPIKSGLSSFIGTSNNAPLIPTIHDPGTGTKSLEQARRAWNRLRRNGRLRGSTAYSTSPFAKAIFFESTVYIMYIVINYDSLIWHQWIEHWKVWGWLAIECIAVYSTPPPPLMVSCRPRTINLLWNWSSSWSLFSLLNVSKYFSYVYNYTSLKQSIQECNWYCERTKGIAWWIWAVWMGF